MAQFFNPYYLSSRKTDNYYEKDNIKWIDRGSNADILCM